MFVTVNMLGSVFMFAVTPNPRLPSQPQYGVFMFATVVGHISTLVSCAARHRTEFQRVRDSIKLYLQTRYTRGWLPAEPEYGRIYLSMHPLILPGALCFRVVCLFVSA